MAEELLINVHPFETRVAMVSHGSLSEIHLARETGYSVTGNIYLGKVERIIPGMQAAFVNIGLQRPGFLHARDIDSPRIMAAEGDDQAAGKKGSDSKDQDKPDIRKLLHEGQTIMVQVEKDPISSKGARLSTQLALASRFLVLMPNERHVGISQRIEEEAERTRLRDCLEDTIQEMNFPCGVIARTAAEHVPEKALRADLNWLRRKWQRITERASGVKAPVIVFEELPLHSRMVRELSSIDTETIFIDHKPTYERIKSYVAEFIPDYIDVLQYYDEPRPLFERHGVEDELQRALQPQVAMRCGGSLVIEQTEAMISIDVNTGAFLGAHSLEETVYRTNLEAAQIIPRQLRLRNLGGIIVIDFIDMANEEHRRQVLRALEKACEADPARTFIEGFSSLGLVQMSRKRTRASLAQSVSTECVACEGTGLVRTAEATCVEVLRAVAQDYDAKVRNKAVAGDYLIRATESVVDRLLDEDAHHLAALSEHMGKEIRMQLEPSYAEGQFDIVLVQPIER